MTVIVDLIAGDSASNAGDPIDIDSVDLVFLETAYGLSSVSPEIVGQREPDTVTVSSLDTGAVALVTGNWPAPLDGSVFTNPTAVIDWINRAGNRTVDTIELIHPDFEITIDFNGAGPTLREFVEDWTADDLLALGPEVNGSLVGTEGPGTPGDDVLIGTPRADDLSGLGGDDEIEGRGRDDTLNGGAGNDILSGGNGNDTLYGGSGRDTLNGDAGDDQLFGGGARDFLFGDAGRDRLEGDDGNDVIRGGRGRDTIIEQAGNDRMFGGGGADRFIISDEESFGRDRILDYDPMADQIILRVDLPPRFGEPGTRLSGGELDDYITFIETFGTEITFRGDGISLVAPSGQNSSLDVQFTQAVSEAEFWESVTLIVL